MKPNSGSIFPSLAAMLLLSCAMFACSTVSVTTVQAQGLSNPTGTNWTTAYAILSNDLAWMQAQKTNSVSVAGLQTQLTAATNALANLQSQYTTATNQVAIDQTNYSAATNTIAQQATQITSQGATVTNLMTQVAQLNGQQAAALKLFPLITNINVNLPATNQTQ